MTKHDARTSADYFAGFTLARRKSPRRRRACQYFFSLAVYIALPLAYAFTYISRGRRLRAAGYATLASGHLKPLLASRYIYHAIIAATAGIWAMI